MKITQLFRSKPSIQKDGFFLSTHPDSWVVKLVYIIFTTMLIPTVSWACKDGSRRACSGTGQQQNCSKGFQRCQKGTWGPCQCVAKPQREICDCEDNNCDGQVDESCACGCPFITRPCSTLTGGPPKGNCRYGRQICKTGGGWLACQGEVKPAPEKCDGVDNDCDGIVDENCHCIEGKETPCYTGNLGTEGVGPCKGGTSLCKRGKQMPCKGQILPTIEKCDGVDNDCDGAIDEGAYRRCSTVQGECKVGLQACKNGKWQACDGVMPQKEVCDCKDNDCDGQIDESGSCPPGQICQMGKCVSPKEPTKENPHEMSREPISKEPEMPPQETHEEKESIPEPAAEPKLEPISSTDEKPSFEQATPEASKSKEQLLSSEKGEHLDASVGGEANVRIGGCRCDASEDTTPWPLMVILLFFFFGIRRD